MGDNAEPCMNLPSLLHGTAPHFHQMALHGYDRGNRSELEEEALPLFIQKLFGPNLLFLLLLAILDKKKMYQVEVKLNAAILISPH